MRFDADMLRAAADRADAAYDALKHRLKNAWKDPDHTGVPLQTGGRQGEITRLKNAWKEGR